MNRGRSLRTAIRFSVVALVVFTVLAVGMATVSFARVLDARDELNNRVNPAQRQVETYLSAVVDQETSLRAFLVAEDATFLDTYRDGVATAEEAADGLRRLLPEADGDTFAAVEEAVAGWEDGFVTPVLEGSDLGRRQLLIDGKEAFDDVRTEVDQLRSALVLEDEAARERLDQATVQLVAILVVVAGSLIGVGIAGWVAYRRRVEGPLVALAADAELVASGELQHPITEVGPEELREVARAMEAMRARIIEEVRQLEAAREILEFQADDLARSNAELEQFAYVASHDLQEPLRKVASFCQLLEQRYGDQFDERAHQYIHYASDGAKRMQVLITDLLAFSRVGRLGADLVSIDLDVALDRALDNLSTVVEESGAEIARDDLPEVQGDPTLLAALFQNLLGNAIKFRGDGVRPEVSITARPLDGQVEILVRDNGIGIDAEHAERVFIIFQRLHGRDVYEGTGIGLALCRKIVEHHGGQITVDTTVTDGALVRFTLPTADRPAPDPEELTRDRPGGGPPHRDPPGRGRPR